MILENKLDIDNQVDLAKIEEKISKQKAKQLFDSGDINKVVKNLTKTSKNILINVSRAIIYASNSKEYLDEAEKSVDYFNSQIGFK